MRAPGLLPLLPLLLLGVSSQDAPSPASPEQTKTTVAADTSMVQATTPTRNPGTSLSTPTASPTTGQTTTPVDTAGNLSASVAPTTSVQSTSTKSNPSSSPAMSPAVVPGTTRANTPGATSPAPTTSSHTSGQHSSSASSRASTTTPGAMSSTVVQQPSSPPASLGSSGTSVTASPVLAKVSNPPSPTGAAGAAATSSPSTQPQRSQPSDHLPKTTVSTGVPRTNPPHSVKDCVVSPSSCVTKQPHSSASSPVQGPASSTRPGSTNTSVTPLIRSSSLSTTKTSLTSQPGSINKVSEATTTLTPGAGDPDQRGHDVGSTSAKPTSASQSSASARPSAPAPGDQSGSGSPGHQHPSACFQNEVICKDQEQDNRPNMYLKKAKSCAEWKAASTNMSFFESFCSTGQHVFNASRETCTVTLTACEPRSRHWAVRAVLHLPLDPEKVLEELKEKDKLEELDIANITYDKMEREMIINDQFSTPLIITIVTLAGSLLLIAAIYGCCHQRFSQKKDQQRLTEELQTMENGYHDNPTLEVMETSSEMQEKKVNLNGELGDSWIVPLDTLMKDDLEEEEDTHL